MLPIIINDTSVKIGESFSLSFQRTLRIPDDGRDYPLPPGLGAFPICAVEDFLNAVPESWREHGGIFIPMYQREALWLGFDCAYWKPNAVKIAVGGINVLTGNEWDEDLQGNPQDYLVCPDQPWLDGIKTDAGSIRQFVAAPLGVGYTVEAQLTGAETLGGIQIRVYEPKPGKFPNIPPPIQEPELGVLFAPSPPPIQEMGLAAGGRIRQKVYPDKYGIETWDTENYGTLFVHIVNSDQYEELTGQEPPPTPVTAETYASYGLPWFDLYDEDLGDVAASAKLRNVKTVRELEVESGVPPEPDEGFKVADDLIRRLHHGKDVMHPPLAKEQEDTNSKSE